MKATRAACAVLVLAGTLQVAWPSDLHRAAERGDLETVMQLLSDGTSIDQQNASGETALYLAAKKGHGELVKMLLVAGADRDTSIVSPYGSEGTAMHVAINWGHIDVVKILLDEGADPNWIDREAGSPLHMAVFRGRKEIEMLLRERGAKEMVADSIKAHLESANIEEGKKTAISCTICHALSADAETPTVGPSLWNIVGRRKASQSGYAYSAAMRGQNGEWTYDDLNSFISYPMGYIPGTKMVFSGIVDERRRANLIAYLRTLSDNPAPLP